MYIHIYILFLNIDVQIYPKELKEGFFNFVINFVYHV